jgi:hypothetical protein
VVDDYTETKWSKWHEEFEFKLIKLDTPLSDFAQIRNQAIAQATQPWVFLVDSDEVVTSESVTEIKRVLESNADGVRVKRSDAFYGQTLNWGEVKNVRVTRLGKKNKLRFVRPIHEVGVVEGQVVEAEIELKHYSHRSIAEFLQSVTSHAQREARFRQANGQNFSLFQLLIYPVAKIGYNLLFKLGILDGWRGVVYAVMMSLHSLLVRVFMYEK